jgi:hypothetical protein
MEFHEWYEKYGQDFDKCLGLTGDERAIAEKAWNAAIKNLMCKCPKCGEPLYGYCINQGCINFGE